MMGESDVQALQRDLAERGVDLVRILWSDLHGVARGKDVTVTELDRVVEHGVAFCQALMLTDLGANAVESGETSGAGWPDALARPDLSTVRYPDFVQGVAVVLADVRQSASTSGGQEPGPLSFSPRDLLRTQVDQLGQSGLTPIMAPELEFYICRPSDASPQGWKPYLDRDTAGYIVGVANDVDDLLPTLMRRSVNLDLGVFAGNHEFSGGQFEINHLHSEAVDAADRAFLFKHLVKEVAAQRGLRATFMGKPFTDRAGSGLHAHVSLLDSTGTNVFTGSGAEQPLSPTAQQFLAGLLVHARALTAILNPTVNSFTRLAGAADSLAPSHVNWGYDNRTAFVRVPPEGGPSTRLELRVGDAGANPYLAFAAILAAGRDGVTRGLDLQASLVPGEPRTGEPLPTSLGAALDELEDDTDLAAALGSEFIRVFTGLKRQEVARYERAVTDWEFHEYAWLL